MYEYISIRRTLKPQPTKDCTKRQVFYNICRIFEYLFVNLCDFFHFYLGFVYYDSDSIFTSIIYHFSNNLIAFIFRILPPN